VLTLTGFLSWWKALTYQLGAVATGGRYRTGQLVLYERILFGCSSELKPEVLVLLWLKASMIGEGASCPFGIIPWPLPYNCGKAMTSQAKLVIKKEAPFSKVPSVRFDFLPSAVIIMLLQLIDPCKTELLSV
jgi:hypothetical protein